MDFRRALASLKATPCYEVKRRVTVRKGYGAGSPCRFFRKLCSGRAMGSDWALRLGSRLAGEVARLQTNLESSAGHSTPWRAKEAATSSINSSIGAPQSNCEGSWPARGAASNAKVQVDRRIPDKPDWGARPGEVTANGSVSILLGGMVSVKGKTRSHLNFESRPDVLWS